MNNKRKIRLANKILKYEEIIENSKDSDKSVQFAKTEIENIIESLSLKDILEIDEYIMSKKYLTN